MASRDGLAAKGASLRISLYRSAEALRHPKSLLAENHSSPKITCTKIPRIRNHSRTGSFYWGLIPTTSPAI
jgi:hypothetical protein